MENQRIRLTKCMLKEALVRLPEHKSIDKITVCELLGEAEINRTTFYKYYSSPFALLEDIQADFLHEPENSLRENDRPISLLNILTYIDTHRTACRTLLRSASDTGILQKILSLSLIMQKMENQFVPLYSGFRKEYAMEFVALGSYAVVKKWLLSPVNQRKRKKRLQAKQPSSGTQLLCALQFDFHVRRIPLMMPLLFGFNTVSY